MAGGGTWETQNKVRPGIYIRFRSGDGTGLTVGNRGTVAICEPMSWGPVGKVMTVEAGADTTPYCGYALTQPGARFLQQIFLGTNRTAGASKVYLFRPSADSSYGDRRAADSDGKIPRGARQRYLYCDYGGRGYVRGVHREHGGRRTDC